jgi:hypothetical protein
MVQEKYTKKIPFHFQFVQNKPHIDRSGTKPKPLEKKKGRILTAWTMQHPRLLLTKRVISIWPFRVN